jgi:hypothetical protein
MLKDKRQKTKDKRNKGSDFNSPLEGGEGDVKFEKDIPLTPFKGGIRTIKKTPRQHYDR